MLISFTHLAHLSHVENLIYGLLWELMLVASVASTDGNGLQRMSQGVSCHWLCLKSGYLHFSRSIAHLIITSQTTKTFTIIHPFHECDLVQQKALHGCPIHYHCTCRRKAPEFLLSILTPYLSLKTAVFEETKTK